MERRADQAERYAIGTKWSAWSILTKQPSARDADESAGVARFYAVLLRNRVACLESWTIFISAQQRNVIRLQERLLQSLEVNDQFPDSLC